MNIAVVYLSWMPYGIGYLNNFLDSYQANSAGHDHRLIIALNGSKHVTKEETDAFKKMLQSRQIPVDSILEFETGQDINIYREATRQVSASHFLYLNTFSQFNTGNWLKYYVDNWTETIGLVGASGSFASYLSAIGDQLKCLIKNREPFKKQFHLLKYWIKLQCFERKNFGKFPSPHIRTNAFFTSKAIFTQLHFDPILNKMQAYYFENGKNSLTKQIQSLGYSCILIDKFGNNYKVQEWQESKLFWSADQDNLLISDNQSNRYKLASQKEKEMLTHIAWRGKGEKHSA